MKKLLTLLSLFALLFSQSVFAQSKLKIGHINSSELLMAMPERDGAQQALIAYATNLEQQLQIMNKEFETKYLEYLEKQSSMSPLIQQTKQKELQKLQNRILEFQESAQDDLRNKENELSQPLLNKAKKAIEEIAQEKGYTYILDISAGMVLYFEDNDDILHLVKKKLGIK